MSAKRLCAQLITRALKGLTEEEEEIVVDYLEDSGISVDLDTQPKELCLMLLEKTMQQEMGRQVPITAYANSILGKGTEKKTVDRTMLRKQEQVKLENKRKELPGCQISPVQLPKTLYSLEVDPELGIMQLSSGESQYTATVSLPMELYSEIFATELTPVLELTTNKGNKGYARIGEPHNGSPNTVYVSPLIGMLLDIGSDAGAFLKVCSSLPTIGHIDFTFYGDQKALDEMLQQLIITLPQVIEAFSYLSLGMVLNTEIGGRQIEVRVDGLTSDDDATIFAGLLPFGVSDIAFDISPDM